MGFSTTNNEVEYKALLMEMAMVQRMGGKAVKIFSDTRLVVDQVKGELEARDERMQGYLSQVRHCNQGLNLSTYYTSLEVETHILLH